MKPRLFRVSDLPCRPPPSHVDHEVAELVRGFGAPSRADDEELVRAHVAVVSAYVGVVEPDGLRRLRVPRLAVDGWRIGIGRGRDRLIEAGAVSKDS